MYNSISNRKKYVLYQKLRLTCLKPQIAQIYGRRFHNTVHGIEWPKLAQLCSNLIKLFQILLQMYPDRFKHLQNGSTLSKLA